jgi:TonB-linked SusC/RagA family outer membrane protein
MTLCALFTYGQQAIRVSGRVVDGGSGEPVAGCAVVVKETSRGTLTDFDGRYSIDVPEGGTLQFSFLGMIPRELPVSPGTTLMDVQMLPEAKVMDEVVVVGYGVQTKQSVVGAIAQVKSDELTRTGGVTTVSNALTGLVPGLTTLNYSGKPGADNAELLIRGKSTWNNSSPLVLVDGVEREMNDVDVSEVESVSVLKDASATAVFGVRGGNGVILITTKRGREGKPVMSASANVIAKSASRIPEILDSYDALWLRNQAIERQMALPTSSESLWQSSIVPVSILEAYRNQTDPERYPDVDWQKEMIKQWSWSQRYNMDVRGGTRFVKYFASLAYTYDGDIIKGRDLGQGYIPKNDLSRYNYRLNLDFSPTSTTTLSVDLDGAQTIERTTLATVSYLWGSILQKGPDDYPIRLNSLPGAPFVNNELTNQYNPVEYFNFSGMGREIRTDINTTFNLNQKLDFFTKGLSLKGLVNFRNYYIGSGPDIQGSRPRTYMYDRATGEARPGTKPNPDNSGFDYESFPNNITLENVKNINGGTVQVLKNLMYQFSLNYDRTLGEHRVTGLANFRRSENSLGQEFSTFREEWAARATYAWANRYLFEANGSYTGSEKFSRDNKFGFFPSASAGWVVTEEPLIKNLGIDDYLDFLKFRFSWGKSGSDTGIARWLYVTYWNSGNSTTLMGYPSPSQATNTYPGYTVRNIGNPDARWETSVKSDFGIDASFLKSRLSATFDLYWGRRDDIFMSSEQRTAVPPWFGAPPVAGNIGRTKEKGWEMELRWNATTSFGLNYHASAAVSHSEDLILYHEDPELTPSYRRVAGFSIDQPASQKSNGIITSWDQMYNSPMGESPQNNLPGMYRIIDYDGNGVINDYDVVPVGYPARPAYMTNITLGAEWKGLRVMVQLYGTLNSSLWMGAPEWPNKYSVIDRTIAGDMWLPAVNPGGDYRAPVFDLAGDVAKQADHKLVDGTSWRLKNAEIAYSFSTKGLKNVGIENMRVYLNGNNLWLWSRLNEDRETGGPRQAVGEGGHARMYPMQKRINFGVRVEF